MASTISTSLGLHPGYVDKTLYAHGYQSRYTEEILRRGGGYDPSDTEGVSLDLDLLRHINCSYFSTHGVAPTLLSLKQHAQALAVLIAQITPTSQYAFVDNVNRQNGRIQKDFRENEAFDWLNDLNTPYDNFDEWHQKPLTDLMNKVKLQSDTTGTVHHCPLESFDEDSLSRTKPRPYASHSSLALHANECLEILDHEYGATGGLMSLLPTDAEADSDEMAAVRNSLLGQWLLFNQHLVARVHDLELSYANSLDVTAGEAAVPMQMLSKSLPGRSSGREIAFPQDKWVLANAGDDIFDHLHRILDRQEAQIKEKEAIWAANGTYGERMFYEQRGGDLYARGLVFYDVTTRFYRLQGKGKSTIFVLPAHGEHPAVQQTRRLERTPTVVSVVTPTWPARVSDWESKYKNKLDEATRMEIQHHNMVTSSYKMKEHNETLATELDKARFMNTKFEEYYMAATGNQDSQAQLEEQAALMEVKLKTEQDKVRELSKLEVRLHELRSQIPDQLWNHIFPPQPGQNEPAIPRAPITIVSE